MLVLLSLMLLQDSGAGKPDLSKTKLFLYDKARGITLRIADDGGVRLTVREKDGKAEKDYTARSAEAFREAYPEEIRRYDLGRYFGGPVTHNSFEDWWKGQKGRLPGLQRQLQEQERWLQEFLRRNRRENPAPFPPSREREFGVKIEEPEDTLRDQLGLAKEEGVIVTYVKPGSAAEKAGVQRFDVFVKLEGKRVTDKWSFRRDVLEALSRKSFGLDAIRGGKKIEIRVETGGKK